MMFALQAIYNPKGDLSDLCISHRLEANIYTYHIDKSNPHLSLLLLEEKPIFKRLRDPIIHYGIQMDEPSLIENIVYLGRILVRFRNWGDDPSKRPLFQRRLRQIRDKDTSASTILAEAFEKTFQELRTKRSGLCVIL